MDKLIPNITPAKPAPNYHHGNLREALLAASVDLIGQQGMSLSMGELLEISEHYYLNSVYIVCYPDSVNMCIYCLILH